MTTPYHGAWLAARAPAPPPALATRLRQLLGESALAEPATPGALVGAAARVLGDLLADGCDTRASALDLLAADALATYAFEAAGETPARLEAEASRAMRVIGGVPASAARSAGGAS